MRYLKSYWHSLELAVNHKTKKKAKCNLVLFVYNFVISCHVTKYLVFLV